MYGPSYPRRKVRRRKPTIEGRYQSSPGRQDFYAPGSTHDRAIRRRHNPKRYSHYSWKNWDIRRS